MKFAENVAGKYRRAIEEAAQVILEKGNKEQRNIARLVRQTDLLIRFVPLAEINVSGNAFIIDAQKTNRRIKQGALSIEAAMGELCLTFSDWTYDVAGQRGCQGTLVHEGLHAYDFARMIAACSENPANGAENIYDITLYELERRAALVSADYLVRIGKPDFIDDGLQLRLVKLDETGNPQVDLEGIELRMRGDYGLSEENPGAKISRILGINSEQ